MAEVFTGSFTQQEPIPEEAVAAALEVMRSGRLHRYNTAPGEEAEAAALERDFAALTGARYCLALASGGYGLTCALRACGVTPGDPVLTNAFTLAPVPGAIAGAGAVPVFVEVTEALVIDLDDLAAKIEASGARVLMLSHMRGHICDMEALMALCDRAGVTVVEDCAHTMGASWAGVPSGRFGRVGCFSTQTYKHVNSGEGGLLISDDAELMARATMFSGSYMFYDRHPAGPAAEIFDTIRYETPNCSGRMDNLRAAILRPQLARLAGQCAAWNARYGAVEAGLADTPGLHLIQRPAAEGFVGSSIQFLMPGLGTKAIETLIAACRDRGVELKWFGAAEPAAFTSRHDSWRYAPPQCLPRTDRVLAGLLDMRLPLTFSLEDCALIARIVRGEATRIARAAA
ncbi:aminotransferase [Maritimibacter sp. 55A14]|uniref:DegT/DnrJ/EryC1/StrS family aminotransferase n=1 Tax=Maritimibacter sp. 55A14 TaxID=2174844 RepID=UPI000D604E70|nr:aminotransferase class I/II-fold pyridoxal phosphate-dependent enzyme [Maritimibacter sp. 55A14]PWE33956.1 aminotransferase [Maritimibacter sp. 55A14]